MVDVDISQHYRKSYVIDRLSPISGSRFATMFQFEICVIEFVLRMVLIVCINY